MTKKRLIAVLIAVGLLVACSKPESKPEPQPASAAIGSSTSSQADANSTAQPPDYKLICDHLIAIAPEKRKAALSTSCVAEYQKMLPSCQNAGAVNECYSKLQAWDKQLSCLDSCKRN
jgi:hypothetical protein